MKIPLSVVVFLAICGFTLVQQLPCCTAQADEPDPDYPIDAPCYKLLAWWVKRIVGVARQCYNEKKPAPRYVGDYKHTFYIERINCTVRCIITKLGLITTDGKIDIDEVTWFMGKYLPDRLQDFIADALTNCLEYADGMNSDDDNCSKFGKMISCASRRVPMLFKLCYPGAEPGFPMRSYPSKTGMMSGA